MHPPVKAVGAVTDDDHEVFNMAGNRQDRLVS